MLPRLQYRFKRADRLRNAAFATVITACLTSFIWCCIGVPTGFRAKTSSKTAYQLSREPHAEDAGPTLSWRSLHFPPLVMAAAASAAVLREKRYRRRGLLHCAPIGIVVCMLAVTLLASSPSAVSAVMGVTTGSTSVASAFKAAFAKAFHSGTGGFLAGACQVVAFMWLRTALNYQYKHGGSLSATLRILWADGGMYRLYQGLFPWAILQAPLSRFGDTAANEMVLGLRHSVFSSMPLPVATALGSFGGAAWRVIITPIDTCKTTLQTDGTKGWEVLRGKIEQGGIGVLWYGWEGNYLANAVGGYPFFFTFNQLSHIIPVCSGMWMGLVRYALIGAASATVSDVTSNSIRVMKTKKQTSDDPNMGYFQAAREVIASDGFFGFMFRGLGTRIFVNILQGSLFTVLWRGIFNRA